MRIPPCRLTRPVLLPQGAPLATVLAQECFHRTLTLLRSCTTCGACYRRGQRDIEREKRHLEREEKRVQAEIKKAAKKGDMVRSERPCAAPRGCGCACGCLCVSVSLCSLVGANGAHVHNRCTWANWRVVHGSGDTRLTRGAHAARADAGPQTAARMMAKELVRVRNAKTKLTGMSSHMGAMGVRATVRAAREPSVAVFHAICDVCLWCHDGVCTVCLQTMAASVTMGEAMGSAAQVMAKTNAAMNPQQTMKTMQQFARQTEIMNMTEDMMDDALADAVSAVACCGSCVAYQRRGRALAGAASHGRLCGRAVW